jgi:excisionase family DNA binding protein
VFFAFRFRRDAVTKPLPTREEILAHKRAVDINFAAEYLDISTQSVRRRIADGKLKAFRVGRSIRIDMADLDAVKQPIAAG